jgi:hypothetical protein
MIATFARAGLVAVAMAGGLTFAMAPLANAATPDAPAASGSRDTAATAQTSTKKVHISDIPVVKPVDKASSTIFAP